MNKAERTAAVLERRALNQVNQVGENTYLPWIVSRQQCNMTYKRGLKPSLGGARNGREGPL